MAEPKGIFIDVNIEEGNVKRLLNQKFEESKFGKKLGYYFSELLYGSVENTDKSIFIFNYDKANQRCFIAYLINHFSESDIALFPKIIDIISALKKPDTTDYAIVASVVPDLFIAYQLGLNQVTKHSPKNVSRAIVEEIMNKFWSFNRKNEFLDLKKALTKRDYFDKNFKNYFGRYNDFIAEIEKPQKIEKATKDDPLWLFGELYTYEREVFYKRLKEFVVLPKADPFTLREVSLGIIADKNHVFIYQIAPHSPRLNSNGSNYQDIIWEYQIVEGVDGGSLEPCGDKNETTYWKDKHAIYYGRTLKKLNLADRKSFEELDFGFGKDKTYVFFIDQIIPIDTNNFKLNKNGFIYDEENIYHYHHKIPLDAQTFKVLKYESEQNPFIGPFILEDRNGRYKYNGDLKSDIIIVTITGY